jgi:hypothetical protein
LASLWVEINCPEHGLERFKIKVIKKYNVRPLLISPKYRSRPKRELSSLIVGRNVNQTEIRDYLMEYFREAGLMDQVLRMRMQL